MAESLRWLRRLVTPDTAAKLGQEKHIDQQIMPTEATHIAKNTTYLTVALVVQKLLSFVFFIFIARILGGKATGDYVSAFAMSSIFGVFSDLGMGPVLVRELARDRNKTAAYLSNIISVKLVLSLFSFGGLMFFGWLLQFFGAGHPPLSVLAVAGLVMIVDSFTLTGTSVFRGWQNLWYESLVVGLNKVFILTIGLAILWLKPSALGVAGAILFGSLASFALLLRYLRFHVGKYSFSWNTKIIKEIGVMATPFALASIFASVYAYSDSVLLSVIKGSEAVGLYSVAAKTMNAFQFIPSAFMAAVYPAMSSFYSYAEDKLETVFQQSMRFLLMISAPLAVGLFILAENFVERLGVDYSASATAVRILVPSLVFVFLSFPIGSILNACNRQHWQTSIIGATMAMNFLLNLWLIPRWSYLGASLSWSITNVVALAVGLMLARSVIKYHIWPLIISSVRICIAVLAMAGVTAALTDSVNIILVVAVSAVVYGAALFIMRELTKEDVRYFYRLFSKKI